MRQRRLSSGDYLSLQYPKNLIARIYQHTNVDVFCGILGGKISFTKEQIEELNRTVTNLPERQRELIHLRYEERQTYKDIAKSQGISLQAAQNATERAVHKIRRRFSELSELFDDPYSEEWKNSFRYLAPASNQHTAYNLATSDFAGVADG